MKKKQVLSLHARCHMCQKLFVSTDYEQFRAEIKEHEDRPGHKVLEYTRYSGGKMLGRYRWLG